jgi:hypothetical protein
MSLDKSAPVRPQNETPIDPPPILGSWPRVYLVVVCYLVALIALLDLFTRSLHR